MIHIKFLEFDTREQVKTYIAMNKLYEDEYKMYFEDDKIILAVYYEKWY